MSKLEKKTNNQPFDDFDTQIQCEEVYEEQPIPGCCSDAERGCDGDEDWA